MDTMTLRVRAIFEETTNFTQSICRNRVQRCTHTIDIDNPCASSSSPAYSLDDVSEVRVSKLMSTPELESWARSICERQRRTSNASIVGH